MGGSSYDRQDSYFGEYLIGDIFGRIKSDGRINGRNYADLSLEDNWWSNLWQFKEPPNFRPY